MDAMGYTRWLKGILTLVHYNPRMHKLLVLHQKYHAFKGKSNVASEVSHEMLAS